MMSGTNAVRLLASYGLAAAAVGAAFLLKAAAFDGFGTTTPFLFFVAAVMVAAWYGGLGPGLFATGLGAVMGDYHFLEPQGFGITDPRDQVQLITFAAVGALISLLCHSLHSARRRSDSDRLARETADRRLRSVTESAVDAIVSTDDQGVVTFFNPAAGRLFGYSASEALGRPVTDLMPLRFREQCRHGFDRFRSTGERKIVGTTGEFSGLRKDGSEFPLEVAVATWDGDRGKPWFTGVIRDISDRKRAEELLRSSEHRYRALAEALPQLIWVTDADGVVEFCNRHWCDYTGLSFEQLRESSWTAALHPEDLRRTRENWRSSGGSRDGFEVEYRFRHVADSAYRWHLVRMTAARSADGRLIRWIGTAVDIDDRKRAEQALRDSERRLRLVTEQMPAVLWTADAALRFVSSTGSGLAGLGLQPNQMAGTSLFDYFATTDPDYPPIAAHRRALEGESVHFDQVWVGRAFQCHVEPLRDAAGQVFGVIGLALDITDRRRAEDDLKLQGEIAANMAEGVCLVQASDAVIVYANPKFEEMFGYEPGEVVGRPVISINAGDDEAIKTSETIRSALLTAGVWSGEIRTVGKDGREFWCRGNMSAYADSKFGAVWVCVISDVTVQKRADEEMRRERSFSDALIDSLPGNFYLFDAKGRMLRWNRHLRQVTGWSDEEISRRNALDFVAPPDRPRTAEAIREVFATGDSVVEAGMLAKDGAVVPYLYTGIRVVLDGVPHVVGLGINIADRRAAEDRVKARERQQAAVAELGRVALAGAALPEVFDRAVAITAETLEVGFCKVLQLRPDGNLLLRAGVGWKAGLVGTALVPGGNESQAGYTLSVGAREAVLVEDLNAETRFRGPALLREHGVVSGMSVVIFGQERPFGVLGAHSSTRRLFTHDDANFLEAVANILAAAIDRKGHEDERAGLLAREQSARAEAEAANRSKDQFLGTLSHELRTPLIPILGWAEMMARGTLDAATTRHGVDVIIKSTRRQAQLINDLLDVSRFAAGKIRLELRPVDLPGAVKTALDAVRLSAEAKGVRLESRLNPSAGPVSADPDRLQQILGNLLSNAVKFTPAGGRVEVALEGTHGEAVIRVSDTGRGIRPDFLPHVFETFRQDDDSTTREQGGLGLGLAIVRGLTELHGGTVHADSAGEGRGATFTVSLPALPGSDDGAFPSAKPAFVAVPPAGATGRLPPLDGLRVLVVDDESETRDVLAAVLRECHAEVAAAASAAEALEAMPGFRPDVLVSDIGMPGEDGYSLIRKIRALAPEHGGRTPAAALTAYAGAADRDRALSAGYQAHVPKPVGSVRLAAVVAALAQGAKASGNGH